MKPSIRVVLYNRVSDPPKRQKDGEYRSRQDPENQAHAMRQHVAAEKDKGWVLIHEYVDQYTGTKSERPAFQELFADAKLGKFDLVIFWSLDRFSREGVLETLKHLETLTQSGVGWVSHTEQYLNSLGPFRDAVLAILACIAKQERIRMSERIKAALDRKRRPVEEGGEGKKIGGRPKEVDWEQFKRACSVGFKTEELCQMFDLSPNWVRIKRKELMEPQPVGRRPDLSPSPGVRPGTSVTTLR